MSKSQGSHSIALSLLPKSHCLWCNLAFFLAITSYAPVLQWRHIPWCRLHISMTLPSHTKTIIVTQSVVAALRLIWFRLGLVYWLFSTPQVCRGSGLPKISTLAKAILEKCLCLHKACILPHLSVCVSECIYIYIYIYLGHCCFFVIYLQYYFRFYFHINNSSSFHYSYSLSLSLSLSIYLSIYLSLSVCIYIYIGHCIFFYDIPSLFLFYFYFDNFPFFYYT